MPVPSLMVFDTTGETCASRQSPLVGILSTDAAADIVHQPELTEAAPARSLACRDPAARGRVAPPRGKESDMRRLEAGRPSFIAEMRGPTHFD